LFILLLLHFLFVFVLEVCVKTHYLYWFIHSAINWVWISYLRLLLLLSVVCFRLKGRVIKEWIFIIACRFVGIWSLVRTSTTAYLLARRYFDTLNAVYVWYYGSLAKRAPIRLSMIHYTLLAEHVLTRFKNNAETIWIKYLETYFAFFVCRSFREVVLMPTIVDSLILTIAALTLIHLEFEILLWTNNFVKLFILNSLLDLSYGIKFLLFINTFLSKPIFLGRNVFFTLERHLNLNIYLKVLNFINIF